MSKLIAVVDDEPDILELVKINLENAGFDIKCFKNATDLLDFLEKRVPSLIVLDLMLPDMDGFEVCKELKNREKYENIPIIMLTAKSEEIDKILGLEIGADDYVTKPFSPRELVARVKAILRRTGEKKKERIIDVGKGIQIYLNEYRVLVNGEEIDLTPTEFKILRMLSERKGWVYSREQILDYLYGGDRVVFDRTIDVHIAHLREKLGTEGDLIKSVRGVGYKLEE